MGHMGAGHTVDGHRRMVCLYSTYQPHGISGGDSRHLQCTAPLKVLAIFRLGFTSLKTEDIKRICCGSDRAVEGGQGNDQSAGRNHILPPSAALHAPGVTPRPAAVPLG